MQRPTLPEGDSEGFEKSEKDAEPPFPTTLEDFRARIFDLGRKGVARIHIAALVGVEAEDLGPGGLTLPELFEKSLKSTDDVDAILRKAEAFGVEQVCDGFHGRAKTTDVKANPLPQIASLNNRNGMRADRATQAEKSGDGIDEIELSLIDAKQDGASGDARGKPREGTEGPSEKKAKTQP